MFVFNSQNSFRFQRPGETTLLATRRHWIVLLNAGIIFLLLALLPFLIYAFLSTNAWFPLISKLFWFLTTVYFLIIWNLIFYSIMIYSLNTIVVTNKRVMDNQQKGLFQYALNELEREKIQDITVKINGMFASFLNYGDIEIQSAGTQNKFYFKKLPDPQKIKEIITS